MASHFFELLRLYFREYGYWTIAIVLLLENAGIPVLPIEADVVDARAWDPKAARESVRSFLEKRVIA